MPNKGKVYLVGAGPGDPKLITMRAVDLIAKADVIVNDRLANPRLMRYARPDAEIVYAGKLPHDHHLSQSEIEALLVDRALQGKLVVRLKGGDPFVFGRGGEEAEALREAGIAFEVVPGISSAVAVPAYAGIPVTSRNTATSVGIITGHESPAKAKSEIKWDKVATGMDTLVFLMGVENLAAIVSQLIENGRGEDTPVAVIEWGTFPKQRTQVGTLKNIAQLCKESNMTSPAVTVVGEVVNLREKISWYENRPLFGKRIVVTRAQSQASVLVEMLEELGADVDEFPVIAFEPPESLAKVDEMIEGLSHFDWVLFTSANGVERFIKRIFENGGDVRAFGRAKLGAIGPKTAAALLDFCLKVDFVPSKFVAETIVAELGDQIGGKSVLIPRASQARDELPDGLMSKGAYVTVVDVYDTVIDTSQAERLRARLEENSIDVITFASSSTVRNFMELAGNTPIPDGVQIACIGPITAQTAREYGLEPSVVAEDYTIEGLVDALTKNAVAAND